MMQKIMQGDCLPIMQGTEASHFTTVITDPPYGIKFMGKEWDHGVPGMEYWKEMLRICIPGAWLLSFGGPRTHHRLTCAIEDAGWEIRDCIMWIYGSGFPKGKGCLKPAYEPIILARKKGKHPRLNIDECRIISGDLKSYSPGFHKGIINDDGWEGKPITKKVPIGRWPANVILDEEASSQLGDKSRFFYCPKASPSERNERLEDLLLQDSGIKNNSGRGFSESDPYKQITYRNPHPTVKPIRLMEYLIKLVTPKDGLILDPFAGSGTTLVAASRLGLSAIGIEKEPEYVNIASKRLKAQSIQNLSWKI